MNKGVYIIIALAAVALLWLYSQDDDGEDDGGDDGDSLPDLSANANQAFIDSLSTPVSWLTDAVANAPTYIDGLLVPSARPN